jgi:hypothetical protein
MVSYYIPPVVIGGVGGSGTRLIAQILHELGYYIGSDLNESYGNLWFTLLFKRIEIISASDKEITELVEIFIKGMTGVDTFTSEQVNIVNQLSLKDREQHSADWLMQRAHSILSNSSKLPPSSRWGWKEPNTHIILDRIIPYFPNMKYIFVVRNGLDMAFSRNQNQLLLWGRFFVGDKCVASPYFSLKYWCAVHKRILEVGRLMDSNFFLLNYDDFCLNPNNWMKPLCDFLGLPEMNNQTRITKLIHPPDSLGRYKNCDITIFDEDDILFVNKMGFETQMPGPQNFQTK